MQICAYKQRIILRPGLITKREIISEKISTTRTREMLRTSKHIMSDTSENVLAIIVWERYIVENINIACRIMALNIHGETKYYLQQNINSSNYFHDLYIKSYRVAS